MHTQFWQPCTQLLHQSGSESSKHKERERKKKGESAALPRGPVVLAS